MILKLSRSLKWSIALEAISSQTVLKALEVRNRQISLCLAECVSVFQNDAEIK